jgi:hypothetical protein
MVTSPVRLEPTPEWQWNISIDPEKWPIFGRYLMVFPLKRPVQRKKTLQYGGDRR